MQARPSPIFGPPYERGTQWIALDVATDPEKMIVVPYRYSFESPLIDCSEAGNAMGILPSAGVRHRQPMHEPRHSAVGFRSEQKMPVVRHDAVRKKCNVAAPKGIREQGDERGVVSNVMKKHRAFSCSIDYVEYQTRRALSPSSRHDDGARQSRYPPVRASVL